MRLYSAVGFESIDHGPILDVKEVAISELKAKCLGMLEEVRKTRKGDSDHSLR